MLALVAFTPALAVPPVHGSVHFEGAWDPIDCGDFFVHASYTVDVRVTTYLDTEGIPIRAHVHVPLTWTLSNSKDDRVLTHTNTYNRISDLKEGVDTYVGVLWHLTIPGRGVVVLDAGRLIVNIPPPLPPGSEVLWQAGPHEMINGGYQVLCRVFE
jgi:hypothetical protein